MRHRPAWLGTTFALALVLGLLPLAIIRLTPIAPSPTPQHSLTGSAPDLGKLPLAFEPNAGQSDPAVRFQVHTASGMLLFTPGEVVLALAQTSAPRSDATLVSGPAPHLAAPVPPSVAHLQFVGANSAAALTAGSALPGRVNYFLGNNPAQWHTDLPTYAAITYQNLYAGIDLRYTGSAGQLKGTYTVAPGADPTRIRWHYSGTQRPVVDAQGNLQVRLADAAVTGDAPATTEQAPVAWQEIGGQRVAIQAQYRVAADGMLGFTLGRYDARYPLTIDPVLTYSTYLGGSGDEDLAGIVLDAAGDMYVAGRTTSSNFPLAQPIQPQYGGGTSDVFVTKLNPSGSTLLYSTYLGGSAEERSYGIAVDAVGNAVITGYTTSTNFPVANPLQPAYRGGLADAFVTKLNPSGSALVYSTYLGGSTVNNGDGLDQGLGIAIDTTGNAYVIGETQSYDFPIVNAYQPNLRVNVGTGYGNAFVTKINTTGSALFYSTYLGGSGGEGGYGITVDANGSAYVTGYTHSIDFPLHNPFQSTCGDCALSTGSDFVTKFSADGSTLAYSTYLGGTTNDVGTRIAVDGAGHAYVTGYTSSINFPVVNAFQPTNHGANDAFLAEFAVDGTGLIYSTYLGGSGDEMGQRITIDAAGDAFVVGGTASTNFPLANPLQPIYGGGFHDAFVTELNPAGTNLIFSTFLGGSGDDFGNGIALDGIGTIYVAGLTGSSNFPTLNPYQPANAGGIDIFIAKISPSLPPPTVTLTSTPMPTQTSSFTTTPTSTPTNTTTGTPAPFTSTPTRTPTNSPASTQTTTAVRGTGTPTRMATNSPTSTPTTTLVPRTATPSYSPTRPATNTSTATPTVPTHTPTNTPTSVPTDTVVPPSNTPPPTASPVPSSTSTPVATPSASATTVPTQTPGPVTVTPSASRTAQSTATQTPPGATATPCTIRFNDVHLSDYFYTPVLYLACHGVISGYADGTYRPYNDTTRAQMVKIVILGFGIPLVTPTPGDYTFTDVPPSQPFFRYVEAATHALFPIVSGYTCGGPGEPCDPQNRPYFRPYTYVTRGQLAKITVVAAGWGLINPASPTFADVAPGSAFYEYVESAACRGIISGYTCGGPGEPCDPQNRPYFRQYNSAARGQIAKIVYGAIVSNQPCPVATVTR